MGNLRPPSSEMAARIRPEFLSRRDLSFTAVGPDNRLINWMPLNVDNQVNGWNLGLELGKGFVSEIHKLQQTDEREAFNAIKFALSDGHWRVGGYGPEFGFAEAVAALAIVGMRAINAGAEAFEEVADEPA